jgi:hypothetical protein
MEWFWGLFDDTRTNWPGRNPQPTTQLNRAQPKGVFMTTIINIVVLFVFCGLAALFANLIAP